MCSKTTSGGSSQKEMMELYMSLEKKSLCKLLIDANGKLQSIVDEEAELIAKIEKWEPNIRKVLGKPKKRYFIVFYQIFSDIKAVNDCLVSTDGEYVNKKEIAAKVLDVWNKKYNGTIIFNSVFIDNIIELNEADYKDWTK